MIARDSSISRMLPSPSSIQLVSMEIVEWIRHWDVLERCLVPRRLHLYELRRKEPLYNPRWPPRRRGLLLANTRQEAPPWFTARDGMIYWDFCLFAPALQRTRRTQAFLDGRQVSLCRTIRYRLQKRVQGEMSSFLRRFNFLWLCWVPRLYPSFRRCLQKIHLTGLFVSIHIEI